MPTEAGFAFPVRVYWEDTDAGGIVFYANYLKFFERARTEWLRALGIEQGHLRERTGGMFVVSDTALRYHSPARLDDLLQVTARLHEAGRATIVIQQQAWKELGSDPNSGESGSDPNFPHRTLLCEGTIRIGWVDAATLRPARIPSVILEALRK